MTTSTEFSNANAAASKQGVINGDDPHQTVAKAKDAVKPYVGSGKYNRINGTVTGLESILGKSRFDK